MLAGAAATVIEPGVLERRREADIRTRLAPLIDDGGPRAARQPIVALDTGERVGAEALSRFPVQWERSSDQVFAAATSIGDGVLRKLLAVRRAVAHLDSVSGHIAINLSPATLLDRGCLEMLAGLPTDRVLLELSEHDPVEDYDALRPRWPRCGRTGLRLGVDDVGAGFSSLRHIVMTSPDVMKPGLVVRPGG